MKQIIKFSDKIISDKRSYFWVFFAVLLFLSLLMVYFYQPLCPGQDFFFHYRRLQALMDGLRTSPYLIYLDYDALDGYGYFTKAFYSDFVLIPFALIGNLTSLSFAYQFMLFTMTVLCGIFTYVTINRIYKNTFAAAISALLYTFAVYRLLDMYHRAALGETLAFTFIPIVFLGLYHIIKGDYKKWYILAIGYSLMIFTHVISSVLMFMTTLILLVIYNKSLLKEPKRIWCLIIAGIVTLLIVSYYTFPMLEQMFSNTFYYESRDIMSKAEDSALDFHWIIWGMFTGIIHPKQAFIPGIGLLLTAAIALRLFVYGKSEQLKSVDIGVIIGLIYLVMASPLIPWSVFPFSLLNFIQMGWRLFEFSSFFFAVAGGYYLSMLLRTNGRKFLGGCILAVCTIFVLANDAEMYKTYRCGRPITQAAAFDNDYHLGGLEYIPSKVPSIEYIHSRGNKVETSPSDADISGFNKTDGVVRFGVGVTKETSIELPLIYYKGYKAEVNDRQIPVSESRNGLVQISIDNPGYVSVYYAGTIMQKIGFYLTVLSIIGLCIYIILSTNRNKKISQ
ncbi:MAG: hypothetical protein ACK5KT_04170 [Dysgonomonas sp.]